MAVAFTQTQYGNRQEILAFPDHYVAVAHTFKKNDGAGTTVDGRKIVKAGTIYPANNNTAKGVVMYDVDITDGDAGGALIIHGFIKKSKLPAVPNAEAMKVLPMVAFLPMA